MKLQIDKNKGYVVIDDNTGRIISILVKGVEGKTDFRAFTSYKREGKKHFDLRTDTMIRRMDPQLEKDIMSGKTKFKNTK